MTDIFSEKKRSEIMSKVRSRDSKIEIEFRKELWKAGFRYRKNSRKHFGRPDIVLPMHKTVIFIDSCFWHGCRKHGSIPVTNTEFWKNKIETNTKRDKDVNKYHRKSSWKVIRVWEHEIKKDLQEAIEKVSRHLRK